MRLMIGSYELDGLITKRIGDGKIILFKYGPGTGGDLLLKQFLSTKNEETHSVLISTHETKSDLAKAVEEMDLTPDMEVISLLPELNRSMENVAKKDKFRTEGIMVTDLLEISSNTDYRREKYDGGQMILSRITAISNKQILPFRMILDSLVDIVHHTSEEEVLKRIWIMKHTLKEKGGNVILASPLDCPFFKDLETTLFDAVIEVSADRSSGTWKRKFLLKNVKGSADPPDEWEITIQKEIPDAMSLE